MAAERTGGLYLLLILALLISSIATDPPSAVAATRCTVTGTAGDDVLRGTAGADRICGGRGNDVLLGGSGNDVLIGGAGRDRSRGAAGNDTLLGDSSGDRLLGGIGDDLLKGGPGNDLLNGGEGDDVLRGNDGLDELDGGPGRDGCFPGAIGELRIDCEDITAPLLLDFDLRPRNIDTSGAAREVTIRARIVDDLSGVEPGEHNPYRVSNVVLRAPEGTSAEERAEFIPNSEGGSQPNLVSGDENDGIYETTVTIPRYSAQGTWRVGFIRLEDAAGNGRYIFPERLKLLGLPTTFEQTGPGDAAGPVVTDVVVTPDAVDTSASAQTISVEATITDEGSGVSRAWATFVSDVQGQRFHVNLSPTSDPDRWRGSDQLNRYAEQGTWHLDQISMEDVAGNFEGPWGQELVELGLYRSFEQTGPGDSSGPRLTELDFTPKEINTSHSPQQITVTARITDDMAGLSTGRISFWGPGKVCNISCESGHQAVHVLFNADTRVSGTSEDGVYVATMELPQYSELGTWKIHWVQMYDLAGNETFLIEDNPYGATYMAGRNGEVQALGFPYSFTNGCENGIC